MIRLTTAAHIRFMTLSARAGALILLLLVFAPCLRAQQDAGATTPSVAPGGPAGSYALSGFESVNLYNGNLNFHLPLMQVGGRGDAGYTMTLPIETRWSIFKNIADVGIYGTPIYEAFYTPNYINWSGDRPGYGPGKLFGRTASYFPPDCNPVLGTGFTLIRLTFIAADGTEYELRDQSRDGQPWNVLCSNPWLSPRGTVFKSSDGTSVTFISDTNITDYGGITYPSGYLMMDDGTRFRVDSGNVTWMRDRNGNKLSFIYDSQQRVTTITDSLNRQVNISYYNPPSQTYDSITWKGYNNTQREIRVYYAALSTVLRGDFSPGTMIFPPTADPNAGNPSGANFDTTTVVSQVLLPNNQSYYFKYNPHLELAEVMLPTGGKYQYDWDAGPGTWPGAEGEDGGWGVPWDWPNPSDPLYTGAMYAYRRVTERRVLPDGSTLEGINTYNVDNSSGAITVNHLDAGRNLQAQDKHYFYGGPFGDFSASPTSYAPWKEGREYQTEAYDTGGNLLRRVTHTWQQRAAVSWWPPGYPDLEPPNDPRIVETVTTLADANLVSRQTFGYDQYNNRTDVYEYDFGAGAPGPLIRRTHTDYVTFNNGVDYAGDYNIHIRNLPLLTQVFDAGGTKRAETLYEYDLYDNSLNHAPLIDRPGISGLDSGFTTGYTTRGNVTRTARTLLDNNGAATGWINTYAQYDIAGNTVKAIDANGNATTLDFSDRFGSSGDDAEQNTPPAELNGQTSYAFASKVTNALGHTAYIRYDYYLGKTVISEDANGVVSSVTYNDALDRPTQGIQARYKVGSGVPAVRRQTTITYDDANRVITTTGDRDTFNDNILTGKSYYDGLGRTWRGASYEGSTNWTIKVTKFDALGRVSQVSNPYRAADPGAASPPAGLWTTTDYDALSRPIKVTTPDGAHVDTAYNGSQVTVTDQAGKKRRSVTDALGRLARVVEDPDGVAYQTDYSYDTLGNLTVVNQGGQYRYFFYDSLGRLVRAKNPEQSANSSLNLTNPPAYNNSWSLAYSYDANGNLTQRIDARGIETKYYYDALNRNWGIDYINGSQKSNLVRVFDGAVNGIGRLYYNRTQEGGTQEMGTNVAVTAIDSYDALGRPLQNRQHFWQASTQWGPGYYFHQTYDLAGNLKTLTYPSGHTVNYSYDQASRFSSFSGNLGGSPSTYADTIGYNPAGQMIKERFGTNTSLYHNQHYNNRLQLVDNRLGDSVTDEWNWNRGAITFYYGTTAAVSEEIFTNDTDNNGNLRRQINWVPLAGSGYVIPQLDDYTYDELNRISSFFEWQVDSGGQLIPNVASQNFSYDRWGNKKITSATGGVNNYNPTYDTTNNPNRIVGLGYDAAGNITFDPLTGGTMTYDPENRMLTATNGAGGSYTYDADGKRVKRITGGQETWYIYGIGGELLAEYAAGAAPSAPQKEYGYRGGQLLVIAEPWSGGNLAWGKATSQSSTGFGGESSRGVDGNTSGNWGDNSVSHTNIEHQPWWQVDLGSVQQIGTVRLWNRTDCCSERLSNFYVLVSDNPFSSTDLTTTINQAGVSSYYTAGPAGLLTEIGVGRSGRYVRVQLAGDNYLSLAEVEVMGGTTSGVGVKWMVQDHLGSTRMVVDRSGSLAGIRRHDFLPFGEELFAGAAIRSASNGYSGDSVRQKFGSKELDNESGLDYFGERYYASMQGRFTTCDPLMASAMTGNPQSWNRFVYVFNNPLRYVDPDGLEGKQAWDQLTEEEQKIITAKLTLKKGQTARQAFNGKFTGKNAQETAALVIAVKNLIDNAGGHSNSDVWQQIQSVDGGWVDTKNHEAAALQISVSNSKDFLNALQKSGKFDVDATYEVANLTGDHKHSARFITATSYEPGMHLVQQNTYADTRFDVHWDPRSAAFIILSMKYQALQLSGIMSEGSAKALERGEAGLSHGNPKTSAQVRQELRRMGIVPRNEP